MTYIAAMACTEAATPALQQQIGSLGSGALAAEHVVPLLMWPPRRSHPRGPSKGHVCKMGGGHVKPPAD